jgi:hypothetical protein
VRQRSAPSWPSPTAPSCGGDDTVYADIKDDVAADCEHVLCKPV